jgi:archaemetzincin
MEITVNASFGLSGYLTVDLAEVTPTSLLVSSPIGLPGIPVQPFGLGETGDRPNLSVMKPHWLLILLLAGCQTCGAFVPPSDAERAKALGALDQATPVMRRLLAPDADFPAIREPNPGDWLIAHPERGQTFDAFCDSAVVHPSPGRSVIYILPLGDFPEDSSPPLEELRIYTEAYFQLDAKILPVFQPEPEQFWPRTNKHTHNRQLLTTVIMDFLRTQRPPDAFCLLGVTMEDLYPEASWNFVFGQAWPEARVGIYSFARYDPTFTQKDRPAGYRDLILKRSCDVLAHEVGHLFGMHHCVYYDCVMDGSNSLAETDAAPPHLCPICLRKLQFAIQFDPVVRYQDLSRFYHRHKWEDEAAWTDRQLAKASVDGAAPAASR